MEDYIFDFVTRLQSISGRNDKESFIKKYKDDETIEKYLKLTLDPMQVYGLQAKKLGRFLDNSYTDKPFSNLFECFEYLKENNTGRDEDAKLVASYINSLDSKLHDFIIKSITKSIKLGANIKTINKALGKELLTEFNVMLAHPFEKYADKIEGKTLYVTEKIDGMRCIIFKWGNKIDVRARSGQPILGLVDIENELLQLEFEGVLDGELLIKNAEQYKDRAVLQETLKITKKDGNKTGLDFWIFDTITHEDFQNGKSKLTYSKRREVLDNLYVENLANIHVLPVLYKGKDMLEIQKILKELESKGLEGIMLNLANSFYTLNRSSGILKMKTFLSMDEFCTGVFEGEGKYKGKLGGITVNFKGHELRVGSGFSDEQRELYWNNPELIIGKVVEVQFFRESQNQNGGLSVSFPVFVAITDKTEASYN